MSSAIGFVILINPFSPLEQTTRLIETLNRVFHHPPVACHQDFGKNPVSLASYPNVRVVPDYIDTHWGDFSCIEAAIKALSLLYSSDGPEWFVYLSGADFPIKSRAKILHELQTGGYDGYIEHRAVCEGDLAYPPDSENRQGWKGETWLRQCRKRYCTLRLDLPSLNRFGRPRKRTLWLESRFVARRWLPFRADFKCFAGEAWFTANAACARRILQFHANDQEVAAHFRKTLVPEEAYFHTVLGNAPELRLSQRSLRYVDWTERRSNPKVLTMADLDSLKASSAHFARKFDSRVDSEVLEHLSAWLNS